MREDEYRFYQSLMVNLHNCVQMRRVAMEGVADEMSVNVVLRSRLGSLIHALNFVKSDKVSIVSLNDFRTLRVDIDQAKKLVKHSDMIISQLKKLVIDHDLEAAKIRTMMDRFLIETRRGVLLEFGSKDGQR